MSGDSNSPLRWTSCGEGPSDGIADLLERGRELLSRVRDYGDARLPRAERQRLQREDSENRLRRAIRRFDGPFTCQDMVNASGVQKNFVKPFLEAEASAGRLIKVNRVRYERKILRWE